MKAWLIRVEETGRRSTSMRHPGQPGIDVAIKARSAASAVTRMSVPSARSASDARPFVDVPVSPESQQISPKLKIETNMSHVMTSDPRTISPPSPNAVSSGWLGNAMFLLRPMANVVAGVRWNYVGDRVARGGFSVVDFTISRQDLFVPGLALRAGVKNASNENVNYLLQRPNGTIDALVYPRRAAWLELAWRR